MERYAELPHAPFCNHRQTVEVRYKINRNHKFVVQCAVVLVKYLALGFG